MLLKNCGSERTNEKIITIESAAECARIICPLQGEMLVGGEKLAPATCILLPPDSLAEITAQDEVEYAFFDIEGLDVSEREVIAVSYPERLGIFVSLVCDALGSRDLSNSFFEAAAQMLGALLGIVSDAESTGNKHVDMAKRYIDQNYASPIKIEDVAEQIGVDRKYLRNLFFKYFGMSTKDYLMNLRIEKAKELLLESDLSVCDVSLAVGYSDALGFSKIFKKYVGVSPTEYKTGEAPVKREKPAREIEEAPKEDIKYFLL